MNDVKRNVTDVKPISSLSFTYINYYKVIQEAKGKKKKTVKPTIQKKTLFELPSEYTMQTW